MLLFKIGSATVETHTTENTQSEQDTQINLDTDDSNSAQNANKISMPHDESESETVSIERSDQPSGKIHYWLFLFNMTFIYGTILPPK